MNTFANVILAEGEGDPSTISGVIGDAVGTFLPQLWLIAPIGLGVFALLWGVPKAVSFFKRLAS